MVFVALHRQGPLFQTALYKGLPFVFVAPNDCHACGFNLDDGNLPENGDSDHEEFNEEYIDEWVQCCNRDACPNHELNYPSDNQDLAERVDDNRDELRRRLGDAAHSVPVFQLSSALDILRWQTFHIRHESYCNHERGALMSSLTRACGQVAQKVEVTMGDKFEAGQVGAQGISPHAHDMTFNQIWNQAKTNIDLDTLSQQLSTLRNELQKSAKRAEDFVEIGAVADAEIEAQKGDGPKALSALSRVGKWSFTVAEKIGIGVATAAIKSACGF